MDHHSKIPVTITYEKRGTQPPLFVAGTFSDPEWEPQEMDCTTDEDGNHVFLKTVSVFPGAQIQYKIRVGEGDWWVLNEDAPIVTDESGNRNNVLKAPAKSPEHKSTSHGQKLKPNPDPIARLQEGDRERLSSTPIGQVSDTAAEVADTAQKLDAAKPDRGKAPETQTERSSSDGPPDLEDDLDEELEGPPLFTHECLGEVTFPDDEPKSPRSAIEDREHSGSVEYDLDKYDLNDPSLERWPSDRKSIYEAVRKVETCRNEDQTYFLGSPVSPVISADRRYSIDSEALDSSSPPSPLTIKAKLDVPRKKSHSSVTSTKSLTSLAAIAEEGGKGHSTKHVDEHEEQGSGSADREDLLKPPHSVVSVPSPAIKVTPELFSSPIYDEDEGVVLKSTRSKSKLARNLESGPTADSDISEVTSPVPANRDPDPSKQHGKSPIRETPETAAKGSLTGQPKLLDEMDELDDSADDEPADRMRPTNALTSSDDQNQVSRQDSDAQNKPVTSGKWLPVFLRVLFYDWIGNFLSRLFRSKQK